MPKYDPTNTILVWRWEDAPAEYKALSTSGGGEAWVAFVPFYKMACCMEWMAEGGMFGAHRVDEYRVGSGCVRIGCH